VPKVVQIKPLRILQEDGHTFVSSTTRRSRDREPQGRNQHEHQSTDQEDDLRALLSGGLALAGLGTTAGIAQAAPDKPGPTIDYPDWGGTVVECNQCHRVLPGGVDVSLPGGFRPGAIH
jgi:hypothetical protein